MGVRFGAIACWLVLMWGCADPAADGADANPPDADAAPSEIAADDAAADAEIAPPVDGGLASIPTIAL